MEVLVTGGRGFLGRRVVDALLERGMAVDTDGSTAEISVITVVDSAPDTSVHPVDPRLRIVQEDFSNPDLLESLITPKVRVVFHLGAAVSGECEQDFDLGLQVNLLSTQRMLEACRHRANRPRLLFTSSIAAYGGDLPEVIGDNVSLTPQTSYGTQKVIGELLINDYSRKGFIDGRCLRLPTIVVRPGKPNKAASSFASAVIREPLEGREYVCPVRRDTAIYVLSPRRAVAALIHASDLPADAWGTNRTVCLPGIAVTVDDMLSALGEIRGESVAKRVGFEPDPFVEKIIRGWPTRFDLKRPRYMGFSADESIHEIIRAFIGDELGQ